MADTQTVEDLGKLVKKKYPGAYDSMPDADVGRKVKAKYPEYSQFTDTPAKPAGPPDDALAKFERGTDEFIQGGKAAMLKTVYGGGDLVRRMFNQPRIINSPEVQKVTTPPQTTAGSVGYKVGEAAPYFMGGARAGASLAEKALTFGAQSGATSTAQTGSVKEGAKTGAMAAATPVVVEGVKALAPPIKALAEKIYKSALMRGGGTKADKVIAGNATPELIKRGFTAISEGSLSRKTQDSLQSAGTEVGKVEDDLINRGAWTPKRAPVGTKIVTATPPGKVDFKAVVDDFRNTMNERYMKSGKVPAGLENEYNAYKRVLKDLISRGPEPDFKSAIEMRRAWDRTVAEGGGFQRPDLAASKEAMRDAANSIRRELSRMSPELAKANAEYSFWSGVNQVIENTAERKTGHGFGLVTPLTALGAMAGGAIHGGASEGVLLGLTVGALDRLLASTALRTTEAVTIDRIGRALSRGKYEDALRGIEGALRAPSPGSRAMERTEN